MDRDASTAASGERGRPAAGAPDRTLDTCAPGTAPHDPAPVETLDTRVPAPLNPAATAATRADVGGEPAPALPFGATIGRYVLTGVLGEGGMGTVYDAHDPILDRRVAIKVMAVAGAAGPRAARRGRRLLREAQALARLSHPNVVAVYDVGTCELGIYLALELVQGATLATWLQGSRSPREVLAAFIAAGRGLEAAHAVGILHRDFKPHNVIVGDDGRVRVLDFGLARAAAEPSVEVAGGLAEAAPEGEPDRPAADADADADADAAADARSLDRPPSLSDAMTRVGAVLGTPRYMAPEQHRGLPASERSDQFSFCVALYEALCGQPPFPGRTASELAEAVTEGRVQTPPPRSGLAPHVRRALVRGLSIDPAQRFAGMSELLATLARDPGARRRRAAALVGLVAAVAVGTWAVTGATGRDAALCQPSPDELRGLWSEPRRAAVRAAFSAAGRSFGPAVFEHVDGALADYRRRWRARFTASCEATHVRRVQSPAELDARLECLRRHRDRMAALLEALARPEAGDALERAPSAIANLGRLEACEPGRGLALELRARDPGQAAGIAAIWRAIDRAEAFEEAGAFREALAAAERARELADASGVEAVRAAAWYRVGSLEERTGAFPEAEATLEQAAVLAARAQDRHTVARAWLKTLWVLGYRLKQPELAMRLRGPARVAVQQAGAPPELRRELANQLGMLALETGDYAAARTQFRASHDVTVDELGGGPAQVAASLNNLAITHMRQGELAAAEALFRDIATAERAHLGDAHPRLAQTHNNLAQVLRAQGRYAEAEAAQRPSLAIYREAYGEAHPRFGGVLRGLGLAIAGQGRHAEAAPLLTQSLTVLHAALGPDHPHVVDTHNHLGAFYVELGELDRAAAHFAAAARGLVARPGQERWLAITRLGQASLARARGDRVAAARALDRAEALLQAAEAGAGASLGAHMARVWLERGRLARDAAAAVEAFERAVAAHAAWPSPALAEARLELAGALTALGRDPERARDLTVEARAFYAATGAAAPTGLAAAGR